MIYYIEYIWCGGAGEFRSKVRIVNMDSTPEIVANDMLSLDWDYDGSSTGQATTEQSQCILSPVRTYIDKSSPSHIYVLCDTPERKRISHLYGLCSSLEVWVGFEQEFFIWDLITNRPLGVYGGVPVQGPYYCGIEAIEGYSYSAIKRTIHDVRTLTEKIVYKCIDIGLELSGYNMEVAPGQTEIQVMNQSALKACDDLMMMRFIAHHILLKELCKPVFDPKPLGQCWNGTGLHTNISTVATRSDNNMEVLSYYMSLLGDKHRDHIHIYGEGNEMRLTGIHETSSIESFTWSIGGRHTSVRIPNKVATAGRGYFEDRRPAGNANPYLILGRIVATLSNTSF